MTNRTLGRTTMWACTLPQVPPCSWTGGESWPFRRAGIRRWWEGGAVLAPPLPAEDQPVRGDPWTSNKMPVFHLGKKIYMMWRKAKITHPADLWYFIPSDPGTVTGVYWLYWSGSKRLNELLIWLAPISQGFILKMSWQRGSTKHKFLQKSFLLTSVPDPNRWDP